MLHATFTDDRQELPSTDGHIHPAGQTATDGVGFGNTGTIRADFVAGGVGEAEVLPEDMRIEGDVDPAVFF